MNKKNKPSIKEDNFWYLRTIDEILKEVESNKSGLDENQAKIRLENFGKNKLSYENSFKFHKVLFDKLNSILIYILFTASIIALISAEVIEFIIILVIILMTVLLGFFQEYKADKTIKALNNLTAKKVIVLRNNQKREINSEDLVVGDIIFLKRGDIIPADVRFIEVSGLQVNEAIITGESVDRSKIVEHLIEENIVLADMLNMGFSSTFVTSGSGIAIVVNTGLNTFIGKISKSIESIKIEKSPIQKKIDLMSKKISYIVLFIAFLLLIILLFKGNNIYFSLILISAVAISGIPESFPLALTLTFSNSIKKMASQNAIVKDLNSVETLGTTTVICTDKTGTLTENKMRVVNFYLPDNNLYEVKGVGYEPNNLFYLNNKELNKNKLDISKEFLHAAILCNDSQIVFKDNEWKLNGEPTEGALLSFAKSFNMDENVLREDFKRIEILPFNPLKKYMVSVHEDIDKKNNYNYYMKGAAEIVIEKCNFIRINNKITKLSKERKNVILEKQEELNKKGLRVLSLASKNITHTLKNKKYIKDNLELNDYIYEGFIGIEDPIREEVYGAVEQCHNAGIKIVMITGDHKLIAKNIGERLNLFKNNFSRVIEGFEIDKLTNEELDDIIQEVSIFARTTPEHKLRIVESFQRKGEIVAMTGDGVNDSPALKKADIGISMGKNGTEVAREASNMILTDDNFATIVKAVKEGRTVYSNIRRFIYYLLTGNFTEVGLIVLAVLLNISLPLTALMILFINIVTSTIPALALSVEPTHEKVMNQRPRNPKDRLLSNYILIKILTLIPFLLIGTLGLFIWELFIVESSLEKAMTIAFVTLICFELFHAFNSRSLHTTIFDKDFFNNPYLFFAVLTSSVLMLFSIYSSFGNSIFNTIALELKDWVIILLVSSSVVIFAEIIKLSIKSEFKEQTSLQGIKINLE